MTGFNLHRSKQEMAGSSQTLDTNILLVRTIYARTPFNGTIPNRYVLTADGVGGTFWDAISTISPLGFSEIHDEFGKVVYSTRTSNILQLSTVGTTGLIYPYVDEATSSLFFNVAYPNLQVAGESVPSVTRAAAQLMPNLQDIQYSTTQSTLKFLGVGDLQISTINDLRSVFFSISSFSAAGYADLSAETRAWRSYVYSTNSTSAGYATFISSIPFSTMMTSPLGNTVSWDWRSVLGSNIPVSTVETYPNYDSGDIYFSTVTFNMAPYSRYLHPNSTTKMYLEYTPSYFFPRMFLGTSSPYHLIKEFSTFVQYESQVYGRQILGSASYGGMMTSQQSNIYASNYYNTPMKLELETAALQSNILKDGYDVNYTVYHRIPGGMANLMNDGGCDYMIGPRGGFSNQALTYDNLTSYQNSLFLHVYNQPGAAPPMPGP
jgi:hypothetical protein